MGDRTPDLPRIGDYPTHFADLTPEAEAVVDDATRLTWKDFADRIEACARALVAAGVRPGDRVATLSVPSAAHLVSYMASVRIGAIWLGLNPKLTHNELVYIVRDAGPRLIFTMAEFEGRRCRGEALSLAAGTETVEAVVALEGTGGEGTDAPLAYADFLAGGEAVDPGAPAAAAQGFGAEDPAIIVYTSGTTGEPKGAVLSHRAVVASARAQCENWWAEPFRILNNLPISHVGGAVQLAAQAIVAGGTQILAPRFRAAEVPVLIETERLTVLHQVPAQYQLIVDSGAAAGRDLSSLKALVWSGSACPESLIETLGTWCPNLFTSYGQTESGGEVVYTPAGADAEELAGFVGRRFPGMEVRLADGDGNAAAPGEEAEIQARGAAVMSGYWRRPEATAEAFTDDGWLRTGDIAVEDDRGRFRIAGRIKEMFKSGGYNVYPREIEIVLENHEDVALAAVVPAPDPLYGEVGHAFLLAAPGRKPDLDVLEAWCRERLANYKVPKKLMLRDKLPMLPVGKVDRSALKAETADGEVT